MAEKRKLTKKIKYPGLHRLFCGIGLLAFFVVLSAGLMAEVPLSTIVLRSVVVIVAIGLVNRVVVSVLKSYEEMNRG